MNFAETQMRSADRAKSSDLSGYASAYTPGMFTNRDELPEEERDVAQRAAEVVSDEKKMALHYDIPMQAVGAVRDAANSIKDFSLDIMRFSQPYMINKGDEIEAMKDATDLPEVPESERGALKVGRALGQFLVPYVGVSKLGLLANVKKAGPATTGLVNGFITDVAAFSEDEKNLSAVAKELGFESTLTNWLAGDEDDSALMSRLKNGLEGAGLGVMFEGVFKAMKASKQAITVKKQATEIAKEVVPKAQAIKQAKANIESLKDGRRTKIDLPVREGKEVVEIDVQRKAAEALGVTVQDIKTGEAFKGIDQVKVRNKINSLALVEEQAFNDFVEVTNSNIARLGAGDKAARQEFTESLIDVFEVNNMVLDGIQDISRIQGFRGNVDAIAMTNDLREAIAKASDDEVTDLMMAVAESKDNPEALQTLMKQIRGNVEKLKTGEITWKERIDQWFMNSILSSPITLASDTISNVVFTGLNKGIEKPIAAGIGGLRRAVGGKGDAVALRESAIFFKSLADDSMDFIRLMKRGYDRQGLRGMKNAAIDAKEQLRIDNMTRFGAHRGRGYISDELVQDLPPIQKFGAQFLNNVGTFPTAFMQGKDDIAKGMLYRSALKERATRRALMEGLSGDALAARIDELMISPVDNIADNMKELSKQGKRQFDQALAKYGDDARVRLNIQRDAVTEARQLTFTDTPLKMSQKVNELVDIIPGGRFVVPFITTIDNLARRSLERTPLGLLSPNLRATIAKGGADADEAIARIGVGSAMLYTAYSMALDGRITGNGPKNKAERDALLQTGWRPRSVLVGDKYVDFTRMIGPLAFILQVPANYAELGKYNDGDPADLERDMTDQIFLAAAATGQTLLSQSWAQGLANMFEDIASQDEKRLERTAENLAASFVVPNAITFLANEVNPMLQEVNGLDERIQTKLGIEVRPKRDVFGEPIKRDDYLSIFLPATESRLKDIPEWKRRLFDANAYPSKPDKRPSIDLGPAGSASVEINTEQYERMLELIGSVKLVGDKNVKDVISKIAMNENIPQVFKIPGSGLSLNEAVEKAYREAKKKAVAQLALEYPELRERARLSLIKKYTTPNLNPMSSAVGENVFGGASN